MQARTRLEKSGFFICARTRNTAQIPSSAAGWLRERHYDGEAQLAARRVYYVSGKSAWLQLRDRGLSARTEAAMLCLRSAEIYHVGDERQSPCSSY